MNNELHEVGVVFFNRIYRIAIDTSTVHDNFIHSFKDGLRFVAIAEFCVDFTTKQIIKQRLVEPPMQFENNSLLFLLSNQPLQTLETVLDTEEKYGNKIRRSREQGSTLGRIQ